MSTPVTERPVIRIEELQRAWHAVQSGQFSGSEPGTRSTSDRHEEDTWNPSEVVLPVLGCVGGAGATTVALALAQHATAARVVECCSATASGLAAAATEELGIQDGWNLGRRDSILLHRSPTVLTGPTHTPVPTHPRHETTLTVLDVGWELGQVLGAPSWVGDQLLHAPAVVAVTTATVPGLRRLEGTLALLENTHVVAAVVGARRKRWPPGVEACMGRLTRDLDDAHHLVDVPSDKTLAVRGVDAAPLPPALLTAAGHLLRLTSAGTTKKGTPA